MAGDFITRLSDSASLTDILIQMESFLDDLDMYVFRNWFEGEIVDGPVIERHWVSMTLKYGYRDMPDPQGALRLAKYGALVSYKKVWQEDTDPDSININQISARYSNSGNGINNNMDAVLSKSRPKRKIVWLITVKIPRHFIDQLEQVDDLLDSNIDAEHVQAAKDADLQTSDAYMSEPPNSQAEATQDETTSEVNQQQTQA